MLDHYFKAWKFIFILYLKLDYIPVLMIFQLRLTNASRYSWKSLFALRIWKIFSRKVTVCLDCSTYCYFTRKVTTFLHFGQQKDLVQNVVKYLPSFEACIQCCKDCRTKKFGHILRSCQQSCHRSRSRYVLGVTTGNFFQWRKTTWFGVILGTLSFTTLKFRVWFEIWENNLFQWKFYHF